MSLSVSNKQALPVLQLDPRTYDRALACVHCGLCLPACPTYTTTWNEADSPRGRIQMIKGMADGAIDYTPEVKDHLDKCLDCRACETVCPSEVVYHELIEEARAKLPAKTPEGGRLLHWFLLHVLTQPTRLKLALLPARILQKLGVYGLLRQIGVMRILPAAFTRLERMLPDKGTLWGSTPAALTAATGQKKIRVAFFGTCAGSAMFPDVNTKAIALLAACGAEVVYPRGQVCCGAIHHHNGDEHGAAGMARHNIDQLLATQAERIVTAVGGCGAQLREYALLLRDDPAYAEKARTLVASVRDITEVLLELGLPANLKPVNAIATYHDSCHLAHGQKVRSAPRELLAKVPGLRMVPLAESDTCCGAAGTYNLTQPAMAKALGERKLMRIKATGAQWCISGNAGCTLQIAAMAKERGEALKVVHPVEVLHAAVFGA